MTKYLGIDIGTTGIKAIVIDELGTVLQTESVPLQMEVPKPAWAQQNPEIWKTGVLELMRRVSQSHSIQAMGFSGQMHSLVAIDEADRVIRPAILWCDQRTTKQCKEATAVLGGEQPVIRQIGNPILEGFTLPKLLWMRDEEPDCYTRIHRIMLPKDYLVYSLTGSFGIEPSDASGTACFDVMQQRWASDILEPLGIERSILPPISGSSTVRGELDPKLAKELGWKNVQVVSGGADNACAALGIGLARIGEGMVSLGTSGTVLALTHQTEPDAEGKIHYFRHVVGGTAYYMGVMLSAAQSLNWFRNQCMKDCSWSQIETMMVESPIGSNGLLFLPYLQGERTPHRDPNARGVFFGISTITNRADLLRSVIEGVTFGLRESFERIQTHTSIESMRIVGGGAKNRVWCQMIADAFQIPIQVPSMDEGGAFGAAMLAALGTGLTLTQVLRWVSVREEFDPIPEHMEQYTQQFHQYQELYKDLKDRFQRFAEYHETARKP